MLLVIASDKLYEVPSLGLHLVVCLPVEFPPFAPSNQLLQHSGDRYSQAAEEREDSRDPCDGRVIELCATAPRGARIHKGSSQKRRVAQAAETEKGFDFPKKVLEPLGLYCCKATDAEIKNEGIREPLGVKEKLPVESEPEAEVEATE